MSLESSLDLLRTHSSAKWLLAISFIMFLGSIPFAWWIIARLPTDFLTNPQPAHQSLRSDRPVLWAVVVITRTLFGLLLVVVGFVMLFVPGQGLLFMFLGLTMCDFPGKHRLIRRMLQQKKILRLINGIRAKANRPPLDEFRVESH